MPSVGATQVLPEKPGVVPVVLPVPSTELPEIHDSIPAVERAEPMPPADDAWLRTIANSMSRFNSLPAFIN